MISVSLGCTTRWSFSHLKKLSSIPLSCIWKRNLPFVGVIFAAILYRSGETSPSSYFCFAISYLALKLVGRPNKISFSSSYCLPSKYAKNGVDVYFPPPPPPPPQIGRASCRERG